MSYTFLLEQGEESSAATYSAIPASARSNGTPMRAVFFWRDNATGRYRGFRFGMMSRRSTVRRGAVRLMSCAAVSRVRTYRRQVKALESRANGLECGSTWPGSLARYDRASCSWRTARLLLGGGSESFSETWPRSGTMRNGVSWERIMPERPTSATASGFLLTPTATANMLSPSMQKWPAHRRMWPTPVADGDRRTNYAQGGTSLGYAVRMWPTPRTTGLDGGSNSRKAAKARGMWPTPCASDNRNRENMDTPAIARRVESGKQVMLSMSVSGGALNPDWVEWLMGWPIGWTDCAASGMDKSPQWPHSHGRP